MRLTKQEIADIVQPYKVPNLYKYRSFANKDFKRTFTHQELYFARPAQFNDPFDCKPKLKTSLTIEEKRVFLKSVVSFELPNAGRPIIDAWVKKGLENKELFEPDTLNELFNKMVNLTGIYSLSEVNDDILMWAHYASSHTGFCLEFNCDNQNSLFSQALKVRYQDEIPFLDPLQFGEEVIQFLDAFTIKSKHWAYEKERRIFKDETEGGPGVYRFQSEMLKGVILGSRIRQKDEDLIQSLIEHYPAPVELYRAVENSEEFKIDVVPNKLLRADSLKGISLRK